MLYHVHFVSVNSRAGGFYRLKMSADTLKIQPHLHSSAKRNFYNLPRQRPVQYQIHRKASYTSVINCTLKVIKKSVKKRRDNTFGWMP